jgi:hypothetical protein
MLLNLGHYEMAIRDFQQALRINPHRAALPSSRPRPASAHKDCRACRGALRGKQTLVRRSPHP